MTTPNVVIKSEYSSVAHKAISDIANAINGLPTQVTVTVIQTAPPTQTLAAQLRAVLSAQSQYQGG